MTVGSELQLAINKKKRNTKTCFHNQSTIRLVLDKKYLLGTIFQTRSKSDYVKLI